MADYQSTIELKAVTRDVDRKLNAVKKNLKGVSRQVKKAQTSFKKMGESATNSLKKLDAKVKSSKLAIAGFAASFALIAGSGVKAFKVWEDGLNQIETLGVKTMKTVIADLKALRREYGVTGAEATKGYYDIVSAGAKAGVEAMSQLTAATQLAKAGNTGLDKAIKIVTSGVKVFGEQGETAQSIINKLFLAVKYGKTTVAELGNQFGLVAPIMKSAGLGMSDYSAAMAAITAGSIETTVATTGLKAIMSNIVKVTPKAEKAAARLGIEFNVAALKAKGFVGFMQDIKEKTGGSIVEIGKLFESIEAINAVAVLTSDAGIADLIRNFAAMKDSAGTVKEAMDIIRKSFSFNWGVLTQQMNIMSESIGSALVPVLISFAAALGPIVELISALILQHPGIVKLTGAVTAFALAWAFVGLKTSLILTGIITAVVFLVKKFELFANGGAYAFGHISDHIRRFAILLKRTAIGEALSTAFDFVAGVVGKISWENFKKSISESWEAIKTKWNASGAAGIPLSLGEKIVSVSSFIFSSLTELVKTAFNSAWTLVETWWSTFDWDAKVLAAKEVYAGVKAVISTAATAAWTAVTNWWTTIDWASKTLAIKEAYAEIKTVISDSATAAWTSVTEWWTAIDWESNVLAIKEAYAKVKTVISTSATDTWSLVKEWWTTIDWTKEVLVAKEVYAKVKAVVSSTTASVAEAWATVKDWWTTMDWSDKTLAVKEVYAKVKAVVSSTTASVAEAWATVKDWWTTMDWSDKTLAVKEVYAKVKAVVSSTTASVLEAWAVVKEWWTTMDWSGKTLAVKEVYAKVKAVVSSTTASVLEAWATVKDWWTTMDWSDKKLAAKEVFAKIVAVFTFPGLLTTFKEAFGTAWEFIKTWWKGPENARDLGPHGSVVTLSGMFDGLLAAATKAFSDTVTYIKSIKWKEEVFAALKAGIDKIKVWFDDLYTYLVGRSVVPKTVKEINEEFEKISIANSIKLELDVAAKYATTGLAAILLTFKSFRFLLSDIPSLSGEQARLQTLIQTLRELKAARSDDVGDTASTDARERARAVSGHGTGTAKDVSFRIERLRTFGPEILDQKIKAATAEIEKLFKSVDDAGGLKAGRGIMSRMFFGEGTQLTFEENFKGFLRRIGESFEKLGTRIASTTNRLNEFALARGADSNVALGNAKAATLTAAGNLDDALSRGGASMQVLKDLQEEYQVKLKEEERALRALNRAQTKITLFRNNNLKALEDYRDLLDTQEKTSKRLAKELKAAEAAVGKTGAGSIGRTVAEAKVLTLKDQLQVSGNNVEQYTKRIADVQARIGTGFGKVIKGFGLIGRVMGSVGAFASRVISVSRKLLGGLKSLATGSLAFLGRSTTFVLLKKALTKIVFPLIAIYDGIVGFTDIETIAKVNDLDISGVNKVSKELEEAQEALGGMLDGTPEYADQLVKLEQLTADLASELDKSGVTDLTAKSYSAAVNIVSKLLKGFTDLAALITVQFGLEKTTDTLEKFDFVAPVKKVFESIGNIFNGIKNMLTTEETVVNEATGELTKVSKRTLFGKLVDGAFNLIIDGLLSAITTVANMLEQVTKAFELLFKGDFGGMGRQITRIFESFVNWVMGVVHNASFGLLGKGFEETNASSQRNWAMQDRQTTGNELSAAQATLAANPDSVLAKEQLEAAQATFESANKLVISKQNIVDEIIKSGTFGVDSGSSDDDLIALAKQSEIIIAAQQKTIDEGRGLMSNIVGFWKSDEAAIQANQDIISRAQAQLASVMTELERRNIAYTATSTQASEEKVIPKTKKPSRFATGGSIAGAGTGTSDSILAMLSNGEFVINAKAAKGNRKLLEMINSGNLRGFADGGVAGEYYDYTEKKEGYRQTITGERFGEIGDVLDLSKIKKMIDTLDKGTDEWVDLIVLWQNASDVTKGLSFDNAVLSSDVKFLNEAVLGSSLATKELGRQTERTAVSIMSLGDKADDTVETLKDKAGDWAGTFKSFTGPLKDAALNATSFGDALKAGIKGLAQTISSKLLDRAFKPIEDAMDALFGDIFGKTHDGSSEANALYVQITEGWKGLLGGSGGANGLGGISLGQSLHGAGAGASSSGVSGIFGFISSLFGFSKGGIVPKLGRQPQYFAQGGMAKGTDTVPAMLTPGEMVLTKGQQDMLGGSPTYNTYNLEISGNVDQRAIDQIRGIIQGSPDEVNQASNRGRRQATGIRRGGR